MPEPRANCMLKDAKEVVAWDTFQRLLQRYTLPEGERLRIPYSLWLYRNRWINPGLAADHMLGLPNGFFYLAIRVGEMSATWSSARLVPRAYLRVGDVLAWVAERRVRCSFKTWERGNGYLRCCYRWPEPPQEAHR